MVATTATTVTTATTDPAAAIEVAAALGVVAVVLLIVLLIAKELAGASDNPRAQRLAAVANIGVVPLLFAFGTIVISRVIAVLT